MTNQRAFWDASSILSLCVMPQDSAQAAKLYREHPMTVWWATRVEAASAIQRLLRTGDVKPARAAALSQQITLLQERWSEVQPTHRVRELAIDLLGRYPLRAADALQLAAALIWCRENPHARLLFTNDKQMQAAAAQIGFSVRQV